MVLLSLQAREDHEGTGHESCSPDIQDFVRLKDHFSQVWDKLEQATIALYTKYIITIIVQLVGGVQSVLIIQGGEKFC